MNITHFVASAIQHIQFWMDFFPYLAQMITSVRGGVVCNDLWPWPISSRSFNHDSVIKLPKYSTSWCVHSTAHIVLDGFFSYLAQMINSIRGCVMHNDLWPWHICSRSFRHGFAIKLLKYSTSCHVCSTAFKVLDGFCPYLVKFTWVVRIYAIGAGRGGVGWGGGIS